MNAIDPKALRFVNFSLDLARCSLRRGGEQVQLRPKAFDLLRYLAQNPGRLVTKDELMKAIWPSVVVTDDSLVQCIKDIREALSDSDQRIIKTVPRRGYLFAAEVFSDVMPKEHATAGTLGAGEAADQLRLHWRPKLWIVAAAGLIPLALVAGWQLLDILRMPGGAVTASDAPAQRQSVAVLPLVSLAGADPDNYFADGLTEDIISALGRFPEISVRSRSTVLAYKGKTARPDEIGRDLGVRYVVEGSVRRSRERIRVSVQLTDTSRGVLLWSQQYDTKPKETFTVQEM